jgi:hypothetical protein
MNYYKDTKFATSTVKLYNSKIEKWIEIMPEHMKSIIHITLNANESCEILKKNLSNTNNSNLHGYYSAIIAFIEYNTDIKNLISNTLLTSLHSTWDKIRKDNEEPIIKRRLQNKPTEKQSEKGGSQITFDQIVKKRDSLKYGSLERLLLGFYTYLPPVRADYGNVEIVTFTQKPTTENYIRFITPKTSKCIIRDFKTKKTYNRLENNLPSELDAELRQSLKDFPRKYLFTNILGEPFAKRNSFTVWCKRVLKKLFNTDMTLVMFRHAYISTLDFTRLTDEQRTEIGNKMGHSIGTQKSYQWINDDSSEDGNQICEDVKHIIINGKKYIEAR